jgi:hypothetical protein
MSIQVWFNYRLNNELLARQSSNMLILFQFELPIEIYISSLFYFQNTSNLTNQLTVFMLVKDLP